MTPGMQVIRLMRQTQENKEHVVRLISEQR